ncbi:MAG: prepilin peptidase [Alphaproteobacteria bacterium]|nr:prepilin peptidase [Alphaproteobacteria bacterium]
MEILTVALVGILPALVIAAALSDLTTMRIPNLLSGAVALAFFPAAMAVGLPLSLVGLHALVALAALVIGMGLFAMRIIGGGDAKLMVGVCLWLGPSAGMDFVLWTALTGGLFSIAIISARKYFSPYAAAAPGWVGNLLEEKGDIPYGVAIAMGALLAFPYSVMAAGVFAA